MNKSIIKLIIGIVGLMIMLTTCGIPKVSVREEKKEMPAFATSSTDTNSVGLQTYQLFFTDKYLIDLIDTALRNNQELNMMIQEINTENYDISAKKGEYLPFLDLRSGAGVEHVGRYTSQGANDANTEIEPGKEIPDPLGDFMIGVFASWEIDIWRKLRNSRDAQINRYLASVEGQNFMKTTLVAEIAHSYYELLALDKKLSLIQEYILIQQNALKTVKLQKTAGEVTELAVKRFEAEVLSTQSLEYGVRQQIVETENRINFLLGRYPQPVQRNPATFEAPVPGMLNTGIPPQLLSNRPDIKQAEYQLVANKLDVKVARARFYPSLNISAGAGFQAFNPAYFIKAPESILYNLAGELTAPLLNRKAIKADYLSANANQLQAVYNYEMTILNSYIEVVNNMSKMSNLQKTYELKNKEVQVLNQAIVIANELFVSAKADYFEVLITQRDALDARLELIEYKLLQMLTEVDLYRSLGGGWR